MRDRVADCFDSLSSGYVELRCIKLFDKVVPPEDGTLLGSPEFRPILKYLVFGKNAVAGWGEERPLTEVEIARIDSRRTDLAMYRTAEDFHVESISGLNIPNRIIDVVLIGDPDAVAARRKALSCHRRRLRKRLMYRLQRIRTILGEWSNSPIDCVAYRGELALRGRFPGDDIDLLISCGHEDDYKVIEQKILQIAKRLNFAQVDWIAMRQEDRDQKKRPILINPQGDLRLDCYLTVGDTEIARVDNESAVEALWVLGVLKNAKPLLNHEYFHHYVARFEVATVGVMEKAFAR
jgi:hypothetical protein